MTRTRKEELDLGKRFMNILGIASIAAVTVLAAVDRSWYNSRRIEIENAKPIFRPVRLPENYQDAFLREDGRIQLWGYRWNPYNTGAME